MGTPLRVLIVEDSEDDSLLLLRRLQQEGYDPISERVDTAAAMEKALEQQTWDIILCDYNMPRFTALNALELLKAQKIDIPIIIVSGTIGEETAVDAIKSGAHDYIMKNNLTRLAPTIKRELREAEIRSSQSRAEKALQASEERYRTLIDTAREGIWIIDKNTHTTFVNRRMADMLGCSIEKMLGKTVPEFLDDENRKIFREKIKKRKEGYNEQYDLQFLRKDGTKLWCIVNASPLFNPEGDVTGSFAMVTDVTDRKRAEDALHESETTLRSIFRAAPTGIGMVVDRVIKQANDRLCEMLGYSREELLGKGARMLYLTDEDFEYVGQEKYAQIRKRGTGTVETRWQRKDGKVIDVLLSSTPLNPDDFSTGVTFTALDITARKQTENSLQESESRIKTILDSIKSGIVIIDVDTHEIVDANPAAIQMIGAPKEQVIGSVCHQYICPDERGVCPITDLKQKMDNSERILLKANGKKVSILKTVTNILIKGKEYLLESFIDITEKKRLESQLIQSQKMEAIGTIAGGIAHDFNNILFSIIGFTELALGDAKKDELQYKNLQQVLVAGNRAKDLVQQILTFSRQVDKEQKPVQVELIIKEALKLLRATIPSTIEIEQNILNNALVMGDSTQIHQVLMNLCTNAAHAMEDKGGLLTVNLSDVELDSEFIFNFPDLQPGSYINLTVNDTGHGMSPAVIEKVFDPFFTTKGKGEGTGMGLAVVHGIVHGHGGTIYAYSEPGKGSSFKVFLPAIETRLELEDRIERPSPTGTERILFVDDEPAIVNMGNQILKSLGYDVTTRTSSIEALELFRAQKSEFDLVITDMTMPQMTGENLAKELIRVRPDIPVILCSGFSARIDEKKAMAIGIRAFISKPVLKREIAETIRAVLDG